MKARVTVTLKSGVLDPQGQAISGSLKSLGFAGIGSVRQGKVFDIEMGDADPVAARATLTAMCERLLANTVIENFAIETMMAAPVAGVWPPAEPQAAAEPEASAEALPAAAEPEAEPQPEFAPESASEPDMAGAAAEDDSAELPTMAEMVPPSEPAPSVPQAAPADEREFELPESPAYSPRTPELPSSEPTSEPVGRSAASSTTPWRWSSEPSSS